MKRVIMMTLCFWLSVVSSLLTTSLSAAPSARVVRYELVATQGNVNMSGKKSVDFALLINGKLPAPTLTFNEGDQAEITLKNQIPDQEVSIHWHGILLPPEMDGVPYVNTPPIRSGESFTFRFPLRQAGTYWYHSHTNVQEQKGIYGAFIVHPARETVAADKEAVVVLSDWSDEDALQILANLRKDGDYYLYKKGTVRSWLGAMQSQALGTYLGNEWTRMGGMDYSDVGYDAFLINGQRDSQLLEAHPGEKVRVRIINAAASSYFHVTLGQAPVQVIAADGVDIKPVFAKEILIGMAETYDLLFEVPEHRNFELKATAQDGTGSASTWIGMGEKVFAPVKPAPDLYEAMNHGGHGMDHAQHGAKPSDEHAAHTAKPSDEHAAHTAKPSNEHAAHAAKPNDEHAAHAAKPADVHAGHQISPTPPPGAPVEVLTVDAIKALKPNDFPADAPLREVKLVLDGDMERYVWHINGKAIFEDRTIEIKEGERVRFTMVNETMMHHPMHLHGHFFRVQNQYGDFSPLKHTVDVSPHASRTIEFLANEPGSWMLHCHNLYHMKTGMARVVHYSSYVPTPELAAFQKQDPHLHDHTYTYGRLEAATNHAQGRFRVMQTWNELDLRLETRKDDSWELEGDLFYRRWMNRYLNLVLGTSRFDKEIRGVTGFTYLLPMLVESQLLVDHKSNLRLDLSKRFQWSSSIFSEAEVSFRQHETTEWEVSLMYANNWAWAAGLMLTEASVGLGIEYQF